MRVSILGAGDLGRITRNTDMSETQLRNLIEETAKLLAKKGIEIVIVPDKGIPVEIAKIYKENNGKKVIGAVPVKDKKYNKKPANIYIADEKIGFDSWYDVNGEVAALGDVCVVFGLSPGIVAEICLLRYHIRYLGKKPKLIIFENTISQKLPREIEEEVNPIYIKSVKELEKFLK